MEEKKQEDKEGIKKGKENKIAGAMKEEEKVKKQETEKPIEISGTKAEEKKSDSKEKQEDKEGIKKGKEKKKKETQKIIKKDEAVAIGRNLHISMKQGSYICSFIKGKKIDDAISSLSDVIKMKKAVPFKGEIPHRKGKIMSGRYPVKGAGIFIDILKGLKGNAIASGIDVDNARIYFASANWAARPMRRGGKKAKRTNVILKTTDKGVKNG